jgi:hypothetical protein
MWVNFDTFVGGFQGIYSFGDGAGDQAILYEDTANEIHLVSYYTPTPTPNPNSPRPVRVLSTGTWYHFAMVRDSPGNQLKGYLDGELIATFALGGPTPHYGAGNMTFGARGGAVQPLDGNIDEFGYWTTALTDANIQAVYERGLQGLKLVE